MLEIDAHITSNQMYMIVKYCKREETLKMHRNHFHKWAEHCVNTMLLETYRSSTKVLSI